MGLYEKIVDEYDEVTGAAGRRELAEAMLAELRVRHPYESVLDVACGNGMHAMILARMGADVTAADISQAMLDQARARADAAALDVRWLNCAMQDIAGQVAGPFDAILCLGNSLPHLLEPAQLAQTMTGFARLLAPRGVVVLQLLNYARVLSRQERIVGVTSHETSGGPKSRTEYVRFYDFLGDLVRFNVLKLTWTSGRCSSEIVDTLLRPYTPADVSAACRAAGLGQIDLYSGNQFAAFNEQDSDTLMVVAQR